jgi:hypothetical protein
VKKILLALALFLGGYAAGCSSPLPRSWRHTPSPMPDLIQWCSYVEPNGDAGWMEECRMRWKKPVLFSCHGGYESYPVYDDKGRVVFQEVWVAYPQGGRKPIPVEWIAWVLHNLYPEHDIILSVCNAKGHDLHVPRVWYARGKVFTTPDGHYPYTLIPRPHTSVGSVWDFVSYDGRELSTPQTPISIEPVGPATRS